MPDRSIAVTLFNGALRTEDNVEMAHLMRRKSQVLVAYGSCSGGGCIPALSNFHSRERHFRSIYRDNPTIDNPEGTLPTEQVRVPEGVLHLPRFLGEVLPLADVVDVDYFLPGCPPESHQLWNVVELILKGGPLPAKGSVIGAGRSSVCDECARERTDKKVARFHRTWEIVPVPDKCLLEQGVVCMGLATRDGCGGLCPSVNMPCIGCYGPPEGVHDQGAKMAAALGSMIDISEIKRLPESEINAFVDSVLDAIPDYAGTFYKFSTARSMLRKALVSE
jgi:F420-non-reducing hydrogenase small subunit